jgi:protein phosphatase
VLSRAIAQVNSELYVKACSFDDLHGMGTTLVCAVIEDENLYVANIGDSRLYVIGDGIRQVTKDHSWVEEMVRMGALDKEEARTHAKKNIITRAIGTDVRVEGDIYMKKLEEGSFLLLCSDGLTNMVDNATICDIVSNDPHALTLDQVALDLKVKRLIDTANQNGGHDNITALVIRI